MNSPKSDKELDEWLELLSSSTHSPQGKFSAEKSYNILQQRLQPAYRKHKILSIRYTVAVAAGFVLLIGFGWMFYFYQRPVRTLIVSTNIQTQCIQLPDGSKVTLNRHSQLSYPETFNKERIVKLNGEAYFEVAKNKDLPFVVKANGIDVKAIGTAFNVSAYMEDSQLTTTLFNGKVAVQPTLTKQEVLLEPNQVAVYDKSRNKIEVVPYDKKLFAQWRGGFLSFKMMYLQDITKLLERNYNVVFRYENQGIKKLRFSGSFRNNEDLSEILNVIKTNTGIRYQILKDTIVIK